MCCTKNALCATNDSDSMTMTQIQTDNKDTLDLSFSLRLEREQMIHVISSAWSVVYLSPNDNVILLLSAACFCNLLQSLHLLNISEAIHPKVKVKANLFDGNMSRIKVAAWPWSSYLIDLPLRSAFVKQAC